MSRVRSLRLSGLQGPLSHTAPGLGLKMPCTWYLLVPWKCATETLSIPSPAILGPWVPTRLLCSGDRKQEMALPRDSFSFPLSTSSFLRQQGPPGVAPMREKPHDGLERESTKKWKCVAYCIVVRSLFNKHKTESESLSAIYIGKAFCLKK